MHIQYVNRDLELVGRNYIPPQIGLPGAITNEGPVRIGDIRAPSPPSASERSAFEVSPSQPIWCAY
jgi:hypothetical protein